MINLIVNWRLTEYMGCNVVSCTSCCKSLSAGVTDVHADMHTDRQTDKDRDTNGCIDV